MKPNPKMHMVQETTRQTAQSSADLQQQIRLRAYELYEQRGRECGRDLEHWLEAESEVAQKKAKAVAT